ncbi:hypothetical protein CAOG_01310 [Capsaspora owczarzaki ATCC 30864]|uniref:hypothetical protein n=1 Tax=Capsaspora owczarzaki (strain ATCC 30864) TaxID=595528 RepID=UPI0001FE6E3A|nr:hypothetical protein CAOG_01310 [Capsaspora owczarzaki ATCC 30864]|eukprot:XP_004349830.1 hypothetical protein CAOG_01310 [Capsaspora owczarzaki ATCC 30864]
MGAASLDAGDCNFISVVLGIIVNIVNIVNIVVGLGVSVLVVVVAAQLDLIISVWNDKQPLAAAAHFRFHCSSNKAAIDDGQP